MTKQEAERILANVACGCDGRGVVPGPHGVVIECPNCDGKFISNEQLKEARAVIMKVVKPL